MKKIILIIIFSFLYIGTSFASEIILRCETNNSIRYEIEIRLKDKILWLDGAKFNIETIGERTIVAEREFVGRIKIDRFDGFLDIKIGTTTIKGYCKRYNRIF